MVLRSSVVRDGWMGSESTSLAIFSAIGYDCELYIG